MRKLAAADVIVELPSKLSMNAKKQGYDACGGSGLLVVMEKRGKGDELSIPKPARVYDK